MSDRLRQIWSGFESQTTRRLTGRGVEGIATPPRHDWAADISEAPEGIAAPAQAAFAALEHRLTKAERRAQARELRRRAKSGEDASFHGDDAPPAPLSAEAALDGAPAAVADLIRGLKATEARVERSSDTYAARLAAAGGKLQKPGRKKFLGIF